jgi:hypothetical protein
MSRGPARTVILLAVLLVLAAAAALRWAAGRSHQRAARSVAAAPAPADTGAPSPGAAEAADDEPFGDVDDAGRAWASVDMDAIRKALPDNLYWTMAVPTKDPAVIRAREEERERWNVEYGKVLSGTATAEEVDAYYAHRQRVSEDYLEFIVYLLQNYGYQIPPRDVAALKLAAEMHNARLEEIPRQITEAQQRREAHEAARREWLAQQRAFSGDSGGAAR